MMVNSIGNVVPNEDQLQVFNLVTEVTRGTAVAVKTFGLYGKLDCAIARPLVSDPEYNGTYWADIDPSYGPSVITATYAQSLTYEDWAILQRYAVKGGPTITSDGGTPAAGTITALKPTLIRDDLDSFSFEHGAPGIPFAGTMGMVDEFTISADIDNATAAWQFASKLFVQTYAPIAATLGTATGGSTSTVIKLAAGWTVNQFAGGYVTMLTGAAAGNVREIASNDATTLTIVNLFTAAVVNTDTFSISGMFTAGIATRTRNRIAAPGTQVYLDLATGTIGTTLLNNKVISWSVTVAKNLAGKRFMENVDGFGPIIGRGRVAVTGQLRIEFNSLTEYNYWVNKTELQMRIKQTGPALNAVVTNALAQIDIVRLVWDTPTPDVRGNNLTRTMSFMGYYDKTAGAAPISFTTKSLVVTLP
jgi:hypothetical protein